MRNTVFRNSGRLFGAEVYDAELHRAMSAMDTILSCGKDKEYTAIYVMLDNSSVVKALQSGIKFSSAGRVENFQRIATTSDALVKVVWTIGHEEIAGNEIADQLAKEELNSQDFTGPGTRSLPKIITVAAIENQARNTMKELTTEWWFSACPRRYADIEIKMSRKKPPELSLSRAVFARLLAARTGHGDFAAYPRRWNHEKADLYCSCGREKLVGHLTQCRKALANWRSTSGHRRVVSLELILGKKVWQLFERAAEYILDRLSSGAWWLCLNM